MPTRGQRRDKQSSKRCCLSGRLRTFLSSTRTALENFLRRRQTTFSRKRPNCLHCAVPGLLGNSSLSAHEFSSPFLRLPHTAPLKLTISLTRGNFHGQDLSLELRPSLSR